MTIPAPRGLRIAFVVTFVTGVAPYAFAQADNGARVAAHGDVGMVMNANATELPRDCDRIRDEHRITVRTSTDYAVDRPGYVFGMNDHEYRVTPCSRVTVTFINEDDVRHQWMVHGLPTYLYPGGMFHIEVAGGHRQTGTFIVPSDHKTYLVHCDMAQHMEKGMKAQLKVGRGSGDLPSIPTVTAAFERDSYLPDFTTWWVFTAVTAGFVLAWLGLRRSSRSP